MRSWAALGFAWVLDETVLRTAVYSNGNPGRVSPLKKISTENHDAEELRARKKTESDIAKRRFQWHTRQSDPKNRDRVSLRRVLREDFKVPGQGENPHYELLWKSNIGRSANSVSPGMHSGGKDVTMVVFWSSELEFEKTKVCENPASKGPKWHELGIWHCCSRGNLCQSAKGLYIYLQF